MPVYVDDYVLLTADQVDFPALDNEVLEALFERFPAKDPDMAMGAIEELGRRAVDDASTRHRTADLAHEALRGGSLKEGLFAFTLAILYYCDRQRGQSMITQVIDTSDYNAVYDAVVCLVPDVKLYRGEPEFDRAVAAVAARLERERRAGRQLGDEELEFLLEVNS